MALVQAVEEIGRRQKEKKKPVCQYKKRRASKIASVCLTSFFVLLYKTNRLHFAVVCSVIDTRYDVKPGKNISDPLA